MDRRKVIPTIVVYLVLIGLAGGCGDQFDPASEVNKFRILGISVNHPEVYPAEIQEEHAGPIVFDILWHDPEDRNIQFGWILCEGDIPAGTNLEFCELLDSNNLPPVVENAANGGDSFEIPEIPPEMFEAMAFGERFKATAIVLLCAGGQLPGADELMEYQDTPNLNDLCEEGDGLSAFKTITLTRADAGSDEANENPQIESVVVGDVVLSNLAPDSPNGVVIPACESSSDCDMDIEIESILSPDQYQDYTVIEFGEPVQQSERLFVSWFSTGGEFEKPRTVSDSPSDPFIVNWNPVEPGNYLLWAVAHDLRGGASWKQYSLQIE